MKKRRKTSPHVVFHSVIDAVSNFSEKASLVYLLVGLILLLGATLCAYCTLPADIRDILTPIIGGAFSLLLIPLVLEKVKRDAAQREKSYEMNAPLYKEYVNLAIGICQEDSFDTSKCAHHQAMLMEFVAANYPKMCIDFPSDIYWTIHMIDLYLDRKKMDVAKYYARKSIALIRKQAGACGNRCDSEQLIRYYGRAER